MATLACLSTSVNPVMAPLVVPTEAEQALADRLAFLADDDDLDTYCLEWSSDTYLPTPEEEAENIEATLGLEVEREAIMRAYFQQLDWEREYELEQREIARHNREARGWPVSYA